MTDVTQLSGDELDKAVAIEVMGWHKDEATPVWVDQYEKYQVSMGTWGPSLFSEFAEAIELEIEERRLERLYVEALRALVQTADEGEWDWTDMWKIRRAKPDQICRAALAAVRGAKEQA